jgi:hypothetical protein
MQTSALVWKLCLSSRSHSDVTKQLSRIASSRTSPSRTFGGCTSASLRRGPKNLITRAVLVIDEAA